MTTSSDSELLFKFQQQDNETFFNSNNNFTTFTNSVESKIILENNKKIFVEIFVLIFFLVGVFGNILALITLHKQNFLRQTKQTFFLRNLLANNLIALTGMLLQYAVMKLLPLNIIKENMKYFCISRVVWRYFGLSSGCVAFIMAAERWLSLSKPFIYRKHITMTIIKRSIYILWIIAAILTYLPLFGFGIYYDPKRNECIRYRHAAEETVDLIYAYLFFTFGILICSGIVLCNIVVSRFLCLAGMGRNERLMRYSESTKAMSSLERRFVKIIIILSISFVVCWTPQMISIILAQTCGLCKFTKYFYILSDLLMSVHFGTDPYLYVLLRPKQRTFITNILKQSSSMKLTNST